MSFTDRALERRATRCATSGASMTIGGRFAVTFTEPNDAS
jgi:hypothetical protein